MQVNGTLINYYFHCKRQCYLHGNRLNLEDNSEQVKIGKAIHEEKAADKSNSEIAIDNIRLDKLTNENMALQYQKVKEELESKYADNRGLYTKGKKDIIDIILNN